MNTNASRIIAIAAAITLTSLGTVSVAQAKQGADDAAPHVHSVVDDRGLHTGHGADDLMPHVSGADDTTPHVSGADDGAGHRRHASHKRGSHRHGAAHRIAQNK